MDTRLYFDDETCRFYDLEHPMTLEDPDVLFYSRLCKETKGAILELACGNGRLLIPILKAGADIDGLDSSGAMVDLIHRRLECEGLRTAIYEQAMESFEIDRIYDLIFIAVTSFQILDTRERQVACLQRCLRHLDPGGRVVLDFQLPPKDPSSRSGALRFFRRFHCDGKQVVVFQCADDHGDHRTSLLYRYEIYGPGGNLEQTLLRTLSWRDLTPEEFTSTARQAGFSRVELFETFDLNPIEGAFREVVAILRP